jgi:hypothetical protein
MHFFKFGNGDLVEVEVGSFRALARVRDVDGETIHVALEQGGYLPWIDDLARVRRFGDAAKRAFDGRILHSCASTAMIEVLGRAPTSSERMLRDTLPDV